MKESFWIALLRKVVKKRLDELTEEQLWKGRRVKVINVSRFTMEDTKANRRISSLKRMGCGFPIAHFVVMFCLATGMVLELCIDPMSVLERRMLQNGRL